VTEAVRNFHPGGWWWALALGALVPYGIAFVLFWFQVPLGMPGRFVYLYSPIVNWRLAAVTGALLLAVLAAFGVWLMCDRVAAVRRVGLGLVAGALAGLGIWSYRAPPDHVNQHVFNMLSPSQDGAFLHEALSVTDLRAYLENFPQRARTPPEQMRGTRVISNPPAATVLLYGLRRWVEAHGPWDWLFRGELDVADPKTAEFRAQATLGLVFCWVATALWLASGPVWYLIGRLYFAPAAATAFAVCCVISPTTLLFTPGKDAAQLLSVSLPLWLWLLSWRRAAWWAGVASGALFCVACTASLAHIWVGLTILAVCVWSAARSTGGLARLVVYTLIPAAVGVIIAAGSLRLLCGLDVMATALAVAGSQGQVTRGAGAMPLAWQLLGIPLFLLLAGPGLWACLLRFMFGGGRTGCSSEPEARFGRYLLICVVVALLATIGFTNVETPRLWMPFLPLLLLGLMLQFPESREESATTPRRLAGLVVAVTVFSALHWSLMDVREAEARLLTDRFFW